VTDGVLLHVGVVLGGEGLDEAAATDAAVRVA